MDYCFFHRTSLDEHEEEQEWRLPILVACYELKEGLGALQVDKKGATLELVKWCCDTFEDSGYAGNSVSAKTDPSQPLLIFVDWFR